MHAIEGVCVGGERREGEKDSEIHSLRERTRGNVRERGDVRERGSAESDGRKEREPVAGECHQKNTLGRGSCEDKRQTEQARKLTGVGAAEGGCHVSRVDEKASARPLSNVSAIGALFSKLRES